jgi:serine/threonine protein kinase
LGTMPARKVGPWTLGRRLGTGGNSIVWRGTRGDTVVALKVVRRPSRRFADEVALLRQLSGTSGVLPFIDADLDGDPAWLATALAGRIEEKLNNATLEEVVAAVAEIARTLADLADRGIHHRDIKPDNLFFHERCFVIGDFGLAEFPDRRPHTTNDRKLGPWGYIAPEMLNQPRDADPGPVDVYSLAKTMWVLASGVNWPPLGEHRLEYPPVRLSSALLHERAPLLDPLIDRATRNDPTERPTMREIEAHLAAWLAGPPPAPARLAIDDLREVAQRLTAPDRADDEARQRASDRASTAYPALQDRLQVLAEQMGELGLNTSGPVGWSVPDITADYFRDAGSGWTGSSNRAGPVRGADAWLWLGYSWAATPEGRAILSVALVRGDQLAHRPVATAYATVEPGTELAVREAVRIAEEVEAAFLPAIKQLLEDIDRQRQG